jgi:hypothetical protein
MRLVYTEVLLLANQFSSYGKSMISLSPAHIVASMIIFAIFLMKNLLVPITRHGLLTHFNGIDVVQARTHITITVERYLNMVFESHGWNNLIPLSLPMRPYNDFFQALDSAIPLDPDVRAATDKLRFRYHGAIGELIWPMITTRLELAFPVVKLSQFSIAAAMIHYDAVLAIFRYLSVTRHHDITYTRVTLLSSYSQTLCHRPAVRFHPMLPMIIILMIYMTYFLATLILIGPWTSDIDALSRALS